MLYWGAQGNPCSRVMGAGGLFVGWLLNSQHNEVRGLEILLCVSAPCPLAPCNLPQLSVSQSHMLREPAILVPAAGANCFSQHLPVDDVTTAPIFQQM